MTAEEKGLWDSFERFFIEPSSREIEIRARNHAGEKIKMASKRKLRKEAVAKFVAAFGAQCFDMKLGEEWDPLFQMKCCGWDHFHPVALWTPPTFDRVQAHDCERNKDRTS